jgi:acetyl-CoA carboxylase biotin carboxyl carrier protein
MDLKIVHRLAQLMERHNLKELEVAEQDVSFRLVRFDNGAAPQVVSAPADENAGASMTSPTSSDLEPEPEVEGHYIQSPTPGTFFVARSPKDAPFVSVGDTVKAGQVIGIVEAMKVMNEIKSDVDGTVSRILVPNGAPVEYGQRLIEVQ